jgi:predicted GTPase
MELLIYSEGRQYHGNGLITETVRKMASNFYKQALVQQFPINILSGETFNFGNRSIFESLNALKRSYRQHKFYVISIIGRESTAKSSLMNILFDTKFSVSIGKQTYGINIIVKE